MSDHKAHDSNRSETTDEDVSDAGTNRRSVLKGLAAAGVAMPTLATQTSSAAGSWDLYDSDYSTVVNVTNHGVNRGEKYVTSDLQNLIDSYGDDTLFKFPEGRYHLDAQVHQFDFNHIGLYGPNATLVPANFHNFASNGGTSDKQMFSFGKVDGCNSSDLLFRGFEVDQTADETGIRVIEASVNDQLEVREIDIHGRHDSGTYGPGRFNIRSSGGYGLVDNFRAPDGAAHVSNTPNDGNLWRGPTGIIANKNVGTLEIKHCTISGFPDNGVYSKGGDGKRVIYGGLFENCDTAALRIGGQGSVIKYPTINIDNYRSNFQKPNGIRLESGDDITVRDTSITLSAAYEGSQAIVAQKNVGTATIQDVDITSTAGQSVHGVVTDAGSGPITFKNSTIDWQPDGGYGVWIKGPDSPANITVDNVTITDRAGVTGAGFRTAIRNDREDTKLTNVEVTQENDTDRTALSNRGDHTTVTGGTYDSESHGVIDETNSTVYDGAMFRAQNGQEGIRLLDESANIDVLNCTIYNGIQDDGSQYLDTSNNTIK